MPPAKQRPHALMIERSTESSRSERSHTGRCRCGWSESASTLADVRGEYQYHLRLVRRRAVAIAFALPALPDSTSKP